MVRRGRSKYPILCKVTAIFLLTSFTLFNISDPSLVYATPHLSLRDSVVPGERLLRALRALAMTSDGSSATTPRNDNELIPPNLGTIADSFLPEDGPRDKLIVYLQSAHLNYDSERNTRNLIEFFQREHDLPIVLLEGGEGKLDSLYFRSFPDGRIKDAILNTYLSQGDLSGGEAASILENVNGLKFYGIETQALYEQNKRAFLAAIDLKQVALEALDRTEEKLLRDADTILSPRSLKFYNKQQAFREDSIGLVDYITTLMSLPASPAGRRSHPSDVIARSAKRDEAISGLHRPEIAFRHRRTRRRRATRFGTLSRNDNEYEELHRFLDSISNEAKTQNESVDIATKQLIEHFQKHVLARLPKRKQIQMNQFIQLYRIGQMDSGMLTNQMKAFAEAVNFTLELPTALQATHQQAQTLAQIKGTKLFEELTQLETDLRESLPETVEEQKLLTDLHDLTLLRQLAKLELTKDEWQSVSSSMRDGLPFNVIAKPQQPMNGLKQSHNQRLLRRPFGPPRNDNKFLTRLLQPHYEFYRLAEQRDNALLQNALKQLDREKINFALIATGGFHTEGITAQLREKQIPYVVIQPTINDLGDEAQYLRVMRGERSFMKYNKGNHWDALAEDYAAKLAKALKAHELTPSLKRWRDRIIQNSIADGRVTQAGQFTKYVDALVQAMREEYDSGRDATSLTESQFRKRIKGEVDSMLGTYFDRLEATIRNQIERLSRGFTTPKSSLAASLVLIRDARVVLPVAERVGLDPATVLREAQALQTVDPRELISTLESYRSFLRARGKVFSGPRATWIQNRLEGNRSTVDLLAIVDQALTLARKRLQKWGQSPKSGDSPHFSDADRLPSLRDRGPNQVEAIKPNPIPLIASSPPTLSPAGLLAMTANGVETSAPVGRPDSLQSVFVDYSKTRMWPSSWTMMSPFISLGGVAARNFSKDLTIESTYGGWILINMMSYFLGGNVTVSAKSLSRETRIRSFRREKTLDSLRTQKQNAALLGRGQGLDWDSTFHLQFLQAANRLLGVQGPRTLESLFFGSTVSRAALLGLLIDIFQSTRPSSSLPYVLSDGERNIPEKTSQGVPPGYAETSALVGRPDFSLPTERAEVHQNLVGFGTPLPLAYESQRAEVRTFVTEDFLKELRRLKINAEASSGNYRTIHLSGATGTVDRQIRKLKSSYPSYRETYRAYDAADQLLVEVTLEWTSADDFRRLRERSEVRQTTDTLPAKSVIWAMNQVEQLERAYAHAVTPDEDWDAQYSDSAEEIRDFSEKHSKRLTRAYEAIRNEVVVYQGFYDEASDAYQIFDSYLSHLERTHERTLQHVTFYYAFNWKRRLAHERNNRKVTAAIRGDELHQAFEAIWQKLPDLAATGVLPAELLDQLRRIRKGITRAENTQWELEREMNQLEEEIRSAGESSPRLQAQFDELEARRASAAMIRSEFEAEFNQALLGFIKNGIAPDIVQFGARIYSRLLLAPGNVREDILLPVLRGLYTIEMNPTSRELGAQQILEEMKKADARVGLQAANRFVGDLSQALDQNQATRKLLHKLMGDMFDRLRAKRSTLRIGRYAALGVAAVAAFVILAITFGLIALPFLPELGGEKVAVTSDDEEGVKETPKRTESKPVKTQAEEIEDREKRIKSLEYQLNLVVSEVKAKVGPQKLAEERKEALKKATEEEKIALKEINQELETLSEELQKPVVQSEELRKEKAEVEQLGEARTEKPKVEIPELPEETKSLAQEEKKRPVDPDEAKKPGDVVEKAKRDRKKVRQAFNVSKLRDQFFNPTFAAQTSGIPGAHLSDETFVGIDWRTGELIPADVTWRVWLLPGRWQATGWVKVQVTNDYLIPMPPGYVVADIEGSDVAGANVDYDPNNHMWRLRGASGTVKVHVRRAKKGELNAPPILKLVGADSKDWMAQLPEGARAPLIRIMQLSKNLSVERKRDVIDSILFVFLHSQNPKLDKSNFPGVPFTTVMFDHCAGECDLLNATQAALYAELGLRGFIHSGYLLKGKTATSNESHAFMSSDVGIEDAVYVVGETSRLHDQEAVTDADWLRNYEYIQRRAQEAHLKLEQLMKQLELEARKRLAQTKILDAEQKATRKADDVYYNDLRSSYFEKLNEIDFDFMTYEEARAYVEAVSNKTFVDTTNKFELMARGHFLFGILSKLEYQYGERPLELAIQPDDQSDSWFSEALDQIKQERLAMGRTKEFQREVNAAKRQLYGAFKTIAKRYESNVGMIVGHAGRSNQSSAVVKPVSKHVVELDYNLKHAPFAPQNTDFVGVLFFPRGKRLPNKVRLTLRGAETLKIEIEVRDSQGHMDRVSRLVRRAHEEIEIDLLTLNPLIDLTDIESVSLSIPASENPESSGKIYCYSPDLILNERLQGLAEHPEPIALGATAGQTKNLTPNDIFGYDQFSFVDHLTDATRQFPGDRFRLVDESHGIAVLRLKYQANLTPRPYLLDVPGSPEYGQQAYKSLRLFDEIHFKEGWLAVGQVFEGSFEGLYHFIGPFAVEAGLEHNFFLNIFDVHFFKDGTWIAVVQLGDGTLGFIGPAAGTYQAELQSTTSAPAPQLPLPVPGSYTVDHFQEFHGFDDGTWLAVVGEEDSNFVMRYKVIGPAAGQYLNREANTIKLVANRKGDWLASTYDGEHELIGNVLDGFDDLTWLQKRGPGTRWVPDHAEVGISDQRFWYAAIPGVDGSRLIGQFKDGKFEKTDPRGNRVQEVGLTDEGEWLASLSTPFGATFDGSLAKTEAGKDYTQEYYYSIQDIQLAGDGRWIAIVTQLVNGVPTYFLVGPLAEKWGHEKQAFTQKVKDLRVLPDGRFIALSDGKAIGPLAQELHVREAIRLASEERGVALEPESYVVTELKNGHVTVTVYFEAPSGSGSLVPETHWPLNVHSDGANPVARRYAGLYGIGGYAEGIDSSEIAPEDEYRLDIWTHYVRARLDYDRVGASRDFLRMIRKIDGERKAKYVHPEEIVRLLKDHPELVYHFPPKELGILFEYLKSSRAKHVILDILAHFSQPRLFAEAEADAPTDAEYRQLFLEQLDLSAEDWKEIIQGYRDYQNKIAKVDEGKVVYIPPSLVSKQDREKVAALNQDLYQVLSETDRAKARELENRCEGVANVIDLVDQMLQGENHKLTTNDEIAKALETVHAKGGIWERPFDIEMGAGLLTGLTALLRTTPEWTKFGDSEERGQWEVFNAGTTKRFGDTYEGTKSAETFVDEWIENGVALLFTIGLLYLVVSYAVSDPRRYRDKGLHESAERIIDQMVEDERTRVILKKALKTSSPEDLAHLSAHRSASNEWQQVILDAGRLLAFEVPRIERKRGREKTFARRLKQRLYERQVILKRLAGLIPYANAVILPAAAAMDPTQERNRRKLNQEVKKIIFGIDHSSRPAQVYQDLLDAVKKYRRVSKKEEKPESPPFSVAEKQLLASLNDGKPVRFPKSRLRATQPDGRQTNRPGSGREVVDRRKAVGPVPVRDLDHKVSARIDSPVSKIYHEETEVNLGIMIDMESLLSRGKQADVIAELAPALKGSSRRHKKLVQGEEGYALHQLIFLMPNGEVTIAEPEHRGSNYAEIKTILEQQYEAAEKLRTAITPDPSINLNIYTEDGEQLKRYQARTDGIFEAARHEVAKRHLAKTNISPNQDILFVGFSRAGQNRIAPLLNGTEAPRTMRWIKDEKGKRTNQAERFHAPRRRGQSPKSGDSPRLEARAEVRGHGPFKTPHLKQIVRDFGPQRAGFLTARLIDGVDGMTKEMQKWAAMFERAGIDTYYMGQWNHRDHPDLIQGIPLDRFTFLPPEGAFYHPENELIAALGFPEYRPTALLPRVDGKRRQVKAGLIGGPNGQDAVRFAREQTFYMKDILVRQIREWIRKNRLTIVDVENINALPLQIPLMLAVAEVAAADDMQDVVFMMHDHDPYWERRWGLSPDLEVIGDRLDQGALPTGPNIVHAMINPLTQEELHRRKPDVQSVLTPNIYNYNREPAPGDMLTVRDEATGQNTYMSRGKWTRDVRTRIGVEPNDTLFLQPTRVIPRKGIEHALHFFNVFHGGFPKISSKYVVLGGDPNPTYQKRLDRIVADLGLKKGKEIIFLRDEQLGRTRAILPNGKKRFIAEDIFGGADFVTMFSTQEGFGRELLEAAYHRVPVIGIGFDVYEHYLKDTGLRIVKPRRVAQLNVEDPTQDPEEIANVHASIVTELPLLVHDLLLSSGRRHALTDTNFEAAKENFSFEEGEEDLADAIRMVRSQRRSEVRQNLVGFGTPLQETLQLWQAAVRRAEARGLTIAFEDGEAPFMVGKLGRQWLKHHFKPVYFLFNLIQTKVKSVYFLLNFSQSQVKSVYFLFNFSQTFFKPVYFLLHFSQTFFKPVYFLLNFSQSYFNRGQTQVKSIYFLLYAFQPIFNASHLVTQTRHPFTEGAELSFKAFKNDSKFAFTKIVWILLKSFRHSGNVSNLGPNVNSIFKNIIMRNMHIRQAVPLEAKQRAEVRTEFEVPQAARLVLLLRERAGIIDGDPDAYYENLQEVLDPYEKVKLDLGEKFGQKAIDAVTTELGDHFVRFLVEPGISTRTGEFVDFAKGYVTDKDLPDGKPLTAEFARELRNTFKAHLDRDGNATVDWYRSLGLTESEKAEALENGIRTVLLQGIIDEELDEDIVSAYGDLREDAEDAGALFKEHSVSMYLSYLIELNQADGQEGLVVGGARRGIILKVHNSRGGFFHSVSTDPQLADDVAVAHSKGNTHYRFKLNIPNIFLLSWNEDYFPPYVEGEDPADDKIGAGILKTSAGGEHLITSPKAESWVEFQIQKDWIVEVTEIPKTDDTYTLDGRLGAFNPFGEGAYLGPLDDGESVDRSEVRSDLADLSTALSGSKGILPADLRIGAAAAELIQLIQSGAVPILGTVPKNTASRQFLVRVRGVFEAGQGEALKQLALDHFTNLFRNQRGEITRAITDQLIELSEDGEVTHEHVQAEVVAAVEDVVGVNWDRSGTVPDLSPLLLEPFKDQRVHDAIDGVVRVLNQEKTGTVPKERGQSPFSPFSSEVATVAAQVAEALYQAVLDYSEPVVLAYHATEAEAEQMTDAGIRQLVVESIERVRRHKFNTVRLDFPKSRLSVLRRVSIPRDVPVRLIEFGGTIWLVNMKNPEYLTHMDLVPTITITSDPTHASKHHLLVDQFHTGRTLDFSRDEALANLLYAGFLGAYRLSDDALEILAALEDGDFRLQSPESLKHLRALRYHFKALIASRDHRELQSRAA